ncbi:MAG: hypothetical protein JNM50_04990 [Chromatiales bacterium]|nr:hypothetical protein [Chromatiales bacterium]
MNRWLSERGSDPVGTRHDAPRNDHWHHRFNADIISMAAKWEYPRYAARDLTFHVLELTLARPACIGMVEKLIEHFRWIASSMVHAGCAGFVHDSASLLATPLQRSELLGFRPGAARPSPPCQTSWACWSVAPAPA